MTIEVNKYYEVKYLSGIRFTTLSKFHFFVSIFVGSATFIYEVCLEPLWPNCGHSVNSALLCWDYQMHLSFVIHEAVLLKLEAVQILFYLNTISFQFCWIWCKKLTILCHFWAFCIEFSRNRKLQNWNKKLLNCLKF